MFFLSLILSALLWQERYRESGFCERRKQSFAALVRRADENGRKGKAGAREQGL